MKNIAKTRRLSIRINSRRGSAYFDGNTAPTALGPKSSIFNQFINRTALVPQKQVIVVPKQETMGAGPRGVLTEL